MENRKSGDNKVITIYDIASEAGVSVSTVSRVLTNNANVRPEKKEKVQQLINKYNFKPNAMARGLTDPKNKVIGIIAADVRNVYYANIFVACETEARKAGYRVLLCNSLGEKEREEEQLEMLYEQRVGAIIQLGGRADDLTSDVEYAERVNLITNSIPLVVTGKLDGTMCYQMQIDAMKAMDLAMEHLIDLGHKRVALVGGRLDVLSTFEKLQRYRQILKNYHLDYHEEYIRTGGYDYKTGYEEMNKLFQCSRMPTAVIAINDYAAAGVARSIIEHGCRVPDDISVMSYDNTQVAELLTPRMTSIDYRYEEFAGKLVGTALAAIAGKSIPRIQLQTPDLVVRESTGAAKNSEV
ncbi:MAG: LacI family transcriptional regulator [Lachnospiraceae bacterium]|jgi:LacI family transcriptional regulator|nr:LacI family DNA-binding transcriptional regulator [uncultured Acetatifactor sp.]MCI9219870.1 LacI family transcriptional regulator [Lachnospiraceae bacterium]